MKADVRGPDIQERVAPEIKARIALLQKIFIARGWTLGLAESCTGGLLSSWIASQAGVSAFFQGAVVSYAGRVKSEVLDVPTNLLQAYGEVSRPVAKAMAFGARDVLSCSCALSVTGIAGPGGGTPEKPVGFVCFAAVGPGFEVVEQQQFVASGGREDIQRQAALFAFDLLLSAIR